MKSWLFSVFSVVALCSIIFIAATGLAVGLLKMTGPSYEPTPVPPPPPVLSIEERICSYDWDCGTAIRVFTCESRLGKDPRAYDLNRPDGGLAQLNRFTWEKWLKDRYGWTWDQIVLDDDVNLAAAFVVYKEHEKVFQEVGWNAWSCYIA